MPKPQQRLLVWAGHAALAAMLASVSGCSDSHEALALYEGSWIALGKQYENNREVCTWLPEGRRHIICKSRDKTGDVPRESLSVYSYDAVKREYVYHGFRADGSIESQRGQRTPTGFLFASDEGIGAKRLRTRFTITEGVDGHFHTVSETAKGDGPFVVDSKIEFVRTR
jgi:hypothetical protein